MSGEKRWSVDDDEPGGALLAWGVSEDVDLTVSAHDMYELPGVWVFSMGEDAIATAHAALVADVRAAARLRSLAAIYEQPLNRDKTFTFKGSELAAMLKEEG